MNENHKQRYAYGQFTDVQSEFDKETQKAAADT